MLPAWCAESSLGTGCACALGPCCVSLPACAVVCLRMLCVMLCMLCLVVRPCPCPSLHAPARRSVLRSGSAKPSQPGPGSVRPARCPTTTTAVLYYILDTVLLTMVGTISVGISLYPRLPRPLRTRTHARRARARARARRKHHRSPRLCEHDLSHATIRHCPGSSVRRGGDCGSCIPTVAESPRYKIHKLENRRISLTAST